MRLAFVNPNRAHAYNADTVLTQALGGSESAQVHLARALSARGHQVVLFAGANDVGVKSGVNCRAVPATTAEFADFDAVFVTNDPMYALLVRAGAGPAPFVIHWEHNIYDPKGDWQRVLTALRGPRDLFAFVSQWHVRHFQEARLPLAPQRTLTIRNAVSPAFENLFADACEIMSAKAGAPRLVFASAPYKGLQPALSFFASPLLAGAELHLYTGLSHYAPNNALRQGEGYWQAMLDKAAGKPGVVLKGVMPQPSMAQEMRQAHVLFYPSIAEETSCIVALEAMAAGMLIVSSDWGALSETTASFAKLIPVVTNDKGEFSLNGEAFARTAAEGLAHFKAGDARLADHLAQQVAHVHKHHLWSIRAVEVETQLMRLVHAAPVADATPSASQLYEAGLHFAGRGRIGEASLAYEQAIAAKPDFSEALNNLGLLLRQAGKDKEALAKFQAALECKPDHAMIEGNLAGALAALGRQDEAVAHYRHALACDPDDLNALNNLGNLQKSLGKRQEAETLYRKAVESHPGSGEAKLNLARLLVELGQPGDAEAQFAAALAARPDWSEAAFSFAFSQFEQLYDSDADIEQRRERFSGILAALENHYLKASPAERAQAARDLASVSHFFMAYQGKNDRDLMKRFGTLLHVLMVSRFPACARISEMPPHEEDGRLRLGIVSPFFREHSIWKIPLAGWLKGLDRKRFKLSCFALAGSTPYLDEAAELCCEMHSGRRQLSEWVAAIANERPHILLYPDIGMDATALKLAALRLAPLQATTLGHPTTTGLPTMDVFFSSALMEPEDGEAHYSERLVRLPGLGVMYRQPPKNSGALLRQTLGLPEDKFLFWCCQSLFKYTPSFDRRIATIAKQLPDARFVFIEHHDNPLITDRLLRRFERAFAEQGLSARDFCLFLPRLSPADFAKTGGLMDVFLDHDAWSGFNSCLESVAAGLLPLTLPGKLMRGRHAKAVLEILDLPELIAPSETDYIASAVRLAQDAVWRDTLKARMQANLHRLYDDASPIRAMEDSLLSFFG